MSCEDKTLREKKDFLLFFFPGESEEGHEEEGREGGKVEIYSADETELQMTDLKPVGAFVTAIETSLVPRPLDGDGSVADGAADDDGPGPDHHGLVLVGDGKRGWHWCGQRTTESTQQENNDNSIVSVPLTLTSASLLMASPTWLSALHK